LIAKEGYEPAVLHKYHGRMHLIDFMYAMYWDGTVLLPRSLLQSEVRSQDQNLYVSTHILFRRAVRSECNG
jgi:hypothetical protein